MTRFWRKTVIIWICGLIAASLVWGLAALPAAPLSPLNLLVFDTYQRLKPRLWAGSDIVIVDLDEASIRENGQWPWPRTVLAEMTDRLHELGAAAIVFDIVFSEPDRTSPWRAVDDLRKAGVSVPPVLDTSALDNDLALAKSFANATVVTGMQISQTATDKPPKPKAGSGFIGTPPSRLMTQNVAAVRNLPILDDAAVGTGEFSFDSSRQTDAVVRFTRLMRGANDAWYPSLALETLRVVQGAGGFKIKSTDGSGEANTAGLALVAVQVGALDIPVNADGAIAIYHSPVGEKPVLVGSSSSGTQCRWPFNERPARYCCQPYRLGRNVSGRPLGPARNAPAPDRARRDDTRRYYRPDYSWRFSETLRYCPWCRPCGSGGRRCLAFGCGTTSVRSEHRERDAGARHDCHRRVRVCLF